MRIYRRAEFLKLPEGTIYCSGKPWYFGGISVKGETWTNDFLCLGLEWIEGESESDVADKMESMLSAGASFPMQSSYGRDGSYDDEELFLVYEKADLAQMIEYFQAAADLDHPKEGA